MLRRRKSEIITAGDGGSFFVLMVLGESHLYSTNTECTVVVQYSSRVEYNRGERRCRWWDGDGCVSTAVVVRTSPQFTFLRSGTVVHASLCNNSVLE